MLCFLQALFDMVAKRSNIVHITYHGDITISSEREFLEHKLLTGKDVMERMLHPEETTKEATTSNIAKNLIDHWEWCNVYSQSSKASPKK